ncbi:hypothetical protein HJA82_01485 [Rhizobium bangladeshense]|uniref:hypothetical protein n=1 Tax=Rhizobium TaxID=379 RepID=UPI001C82B2AA|nr:MULTISPECIES: hypothetical protein [Rhizobium]MBX4906067.1 hypothetical protein [Rhizobium bangladeshense]MBX5212923.1 hypothetical protein [Rhizobium sp. NLR9a]MBX5220021.1 hypothetical protein [Rhizobium sp. NLR8a]MBX5239237.1 hypothetical protein [Rhizobium sp. NLR22b]MBX5243192.1 hypothetical protein [Rhizobium sp. NLR3b]
MIIFIPFPVIWTAAKTASVDRSAAGKAGEVTTMKPGKGLGAAVKGPFSDD